MLGLPFKAARSVEGLGSLANPFVRYCKNMENMTIVMTIRVYLRFKLYSEKHFFLNHPLWIWQKELHICLLLKQSAAPSTKLFNLNRSWNRWFFWHRRWDPKPSLNMATCGRRTTFEVLFVFAWHLLLIRDIQFQTLWRNFSQSISNWILFKKYK